MPKIQWFKLFQPEHFLVNTIVTYDIQLYNGTMRVEGLDGWSNKTRMWICQLGLWKIVVDIFFIIYYLQSQWASYVLVQHYMANENFIQVGSRMMPYALDRQDNND